MYLQPITHALALLSLLTPAAEDPPAEWIAGLASTRRVVDRVVITFDDAGFLAEIERWDAQHYWPVLLWDPALTPVFLEAFAPEEVLFARYGSAVAGRARGLRAIAGAWGADPGSEDLLSVLRSREQAPSGAVLLDDASPEWLGGVALAAGRMHLPLFLAGDGAEQLRTRVSYERALELRASLRAALDGAQVQYDGRYDELDFITVANDWPFGYGAPSEEAHGGGYTLDDLLARTDDQRRWGWVGRLIGGPERSVYMAMGSLFLQPRSGRFWSRYDPGNKTFGVFDPLDALTTFNELFPTDAIRHPDTTLERWRREAWPAGNRHGFLYVNSSGGARDWSMSGGKASAFDLPGTTAGNVASVVHYTHSGSAGRPWDVDSIAGRWMAEGAYVYFGSFAEPYLQAFVPPTELAANIATGLPLGAAMRLDYRRGHTGQREMQVGSEKRLVTFNMSGPWKLAYFGDPSYLLTGDQPERVSPQEHGKHPGKPYTSVGAFARQRVRDEDLAARHELAAIEVQRLAERPKLEPRSWSKALAARTQADARAAFGTAAFRAWIDARVAAAPKQRSSPKRWLALPAPLKELLAEGLDAPAMGRVALDFARREVTVLALARADEEVASTDTATVEALLALVVVAPHSKASSEAAYAWVEQELGAWSIDVAEFRRDLLDRQDLSEAARGQVEQRFAER